MVRARLRFSPALAGAGERTSATTAIAATRAACTFRTARTPLHVNMGLKSGTSMPRGGPIEDFHRNCRHAGRVTRRFRVATDRRTWRTVSDLRSEAEAQPAICRARTVGYALHL